MNSTTHTDEDRNDAAVTAEPEPPGHDWTDDIVEGPFYAEFAHAPVGNAIVGVVIGVLSGVIVAFASVAASGRQWLGVAGMGAVLAIVLGSLLVGVLRLTERGHRIIDRITAVLMIPVAVTTIGLAILAARREIADTTLYVTSTLITAFALLIAVVVLRRLRRSVDPALIETSRANFRAFAGVMNDPAWVTDVVERLEELDALVDQLVERRPIPVRAPSTRYIAVVTIGRSLTNREV